MNQLQTVLNHYPNELDYKKIHQDKAIQKLVYEKLHIAHEQTPFDYIDSIWVNQDGSVGVLVFVEPIGNVGFKADSLENLFKGFNHLFNSQPKETTYAVAGHQIHQYVKQVRKGFSIDFRYTEPHDIWSISLNEEEGEERNLSFEEIVTGRDLFHFVKKKNRVAVGILDGIYFFNEGLEDAMMGEIIYVEEVMPDFFKALIDLSHFEQHNQEILTLGSNSTLFSQGYPKNQLIEAYFSYDSKIKETEIIQLLQPEDVHQFQREAIAFWNSGYDGDFLEYRKK